MSGAELTAPEAVQHAKRYPFERPDGPYLFVAGTTRPLDDLGLLADRLAVIASGSNGAPGRLKQKFGDSPDQPPIPVTRARLDGFSVAYSAHFAIYGSIPATLLHEPCRAAEVAITWLTRAQCEAMHATEAIGVNYGFYCLAGLDLAHHHGGTATEAHAYLSLHGALHLDGEPARLADLPQPAVLDRARALLAPTMALDPFIAEIIADPSIRERRKSALRAHGRPIRYERLERIV